MNLRSRRPDDVEINLTPLIDVVFLLLIFFMVSTTFIHESEIRLTLPDASKEVPRQEIEQIEIAIDANGQYYVNGKGLINSQPETIDQAIYEATADIDDPAFLIKADANTTHQSVVTALDVLRKNGYVRVTFATEIRPDER